MNALKNLVVVGRRNRASSVVSDDDDDDDRDFCCHRRDAKTEGGGAGERVAGTAPTTGTTGRRDDNARRRASLSLYGRRCSDSDLMAVVTSNKFESDQAFATVARTMLHRYEVEGASEREAIDAVLCTAEDKRAFIEALDSKHATLVRADTDSFDGERNAMDDDAVSEIVHQTRSVFDAALKTMWREELASSAATPGRAERDAEAMIEQQRSDNDREYRRQHQPKTPKNLRMSPMQTSFRYKKNHYGDISRSDSCDSTSTTGSNIFQPLKRRRRWFFAENGKPQGSERPVTPPSPQTKPFPIKAVLPKFHFDFGGSIGGSSKKKTQLVWTRPVRSLELDGTSSSSSSALCYMPPTSPIHKVSVEWNANSGS
ncbi:unnamed protein product [Pseudo-nitzschia multistriata]|uniref:Uncharacterized protein n=1 Tax=Pseudo-nitzschia multistriata TaxID=183589 RepID=A0A448Z3M7_9STRA|nr:unnamed protein product [Pseudo-nitzschia multistriata]